MAPTVHWLKVDWLLGGAVLGKRRRIRYSWNCTLEDFGNPPVKGYKTTKKPTTKTNGQCPYSKVSLQTHVIKRILSTHM